MDEKLEIACLAPARVAKADEAAFKKCVVDGGQVTAETLPALYSNAAVLGFARLNGELAGVGAIKRPYIGYRDGIFAKARATVSAADFGYELGWVYVLPAFEGRHIASQLVRELVQAAPRAPLYATSRVNKLPMHSALQKHGGFRVEGSDYPSKNEKEMVRLFIRP